MRFPPGGGGVQGGSAEAGILPRPSYALCVFQPPWTMPGREGNIVDNCLRSLVSELAFQARRRASPKIEAWKHVSSFLSARCVKRIISIYREKYSGWHSRLESAKRLI